MDIIKYIRIHQYLDKTFPSHLSYLIAGSPNAVYVAVGHYVVGGTVSDKAFTVEDCTTNCIQSGDCSAVDYNYNNNTCVIHSSNTVCGPRFPQVGTTHFQYESCQSGGATVTSKY